MSMKEYGGMLFRKMDPGAKRTVFAGAPYSYFLYRLDKGEILRLEELASFSVYVLSSAGKKALVVGETGASLGPGDMLQAENSAVSLEGAAAGTELLVSGVNEPCVKRAALAVVRERDIYKVTKPWGYELWINNEHPGYSLKKVSIRAGHRTSLQYHLHKHETNVIFSGAAAIHYNRRPDIPPGEAPLEAIGTVRIDPVTSVEVSPGTLHRVEALTDISLYETSTPHLDDVIRVHDDAARRNGRIPGEHGGKV